MNNGRHEPLVDVDTGADSLAAARRLVGRRLLRRPRHGLEEREHLTVSLSNSEGNTRLSDVASRVDAVRERSDAERLPDVVPAIDMDQVGRLGRVRARQAPDLARRVSAWK